MRRQRKWEYYKEEKMQERERKKRWIKDQGEEKGELGV